jgi:hypothetical protein
MQYFLNTNWSEAKSTPKAIWFKSNKTAFLLFLSFNKYSCNIIVSNQMQYNKQDVVSTAYIYFIGKAY